MTHEVTISIAFANAGAQERSYGPHVTDATVEITIPENAVGAVFYLDQPYAEQVIKALVRNYCDGGEQHAEGGMNDYFSPHLVKLERTEFEERRHAKWHVRIETPFTD